MEKNFLDTPLALDGLFAHLNKRLESLHTLPTIASQEAIENALQNLPASLPESGLGASHALEQVERTILPALAPGHNGPRFVILEVGHNINCRNIHTA